MAVVAGSVSMVVGPMFAARPEIICHLVGGHGDNTSFLLVSCGREGFQVFNSAC